MKKVIITIIMFGLILSCKLLDRVEEQKANVVIALDFGQINNDSILEKGKFEALIINNIDKATLVVYDINQSYSTVKNNYSNMVIQSSHLITDFENYWVDGVENSLNDISSDRCKVESRYPMDILNNIASREIKLDAGVKYFLVGLFESNKLKYTGYSTIINLDVGDIQTVEIPVDTANTSPIADFYFTPPSGGTTSTVFNFYATKSSDTEDTFSELKFRWDWENDGQYNTDYSTQLRMTTKNFSLSGYHVVKLKVMDTGGMVDTTTRTVSVSSSN